MSDGDVVWDGDYLDFIHINRDGHRVLDHSKIDLLKTFKVRQMFPVLPPLQSLCTEMISLAYFRGQHVNLGTQSAQVASGLKLRSCPAWIHLIFVMVTWLHNSFVHVCTLCLHAEEGCYVKLWTTLSSTS